MSASDELLLEISRRYNEAPTLVLPIGLETALEKIAPLLKKQSRADYWKGQPARDYEDEPQVDSIKTIVTQEKYDSLKERLESTLCRSLELRVALENIVGAQGSRYSDAIVKARATLAKESL